MQDRVGNMINKTYIPLTLLISIIASLTFCTGSARSDEVVVTRHAVIRDAPKSWGYRLGTAEPGERFSLVSSEATDRWYLIDYYGEQAWIYSHWIDVEQTSGNGIVTIASFNTLRLGHGDSKVLPLVAAILSRYDIVALQEVMLESALTDLLLELESRDYSGNIVNWDYIVSPTMGYNPDYQEAYAFIWRTDRVDHIPGSDFVWFDADNEFSREPFVSDFRAGSFDFTLISSHFPYDSDLRADEAKKMADVFAEIQDSDPLENDVILVGDFNLSSGSGSWNDLKALPHITFMLAPPTRTSIGYTKMSKLYDNIWFQAHHLGEWTGDAGTYEFFHDFDDEDKFTAARWYVSDHVPIYAVFRTDMIDDD